MRVPEPSECNGFLTEIAPLTIPSSVSNPTDLEKISLSVWFMNLSEMRRKNGWRVIEKPCMKEDK
jgi:hypothetical protein